MVMFPPPRKLPPRKRRFGGLEEGRVQTYTEMPFVTAAKVGFRGQGAGGASSPCSRHLPLESGAPRSATG